MGIKERLWPFLAAGYKCVHEYAKKIIYHKGEKNEYKWKNEAIAKSIEQKRVPGKSKCTAVFFQRARKNDKSISCIDTGRLLF